MGPEQSPGGDRDWPGEAALLPRARDNVRTGRGRDFGGTASRAEQMPHTEAQGRKHGPRRTQRGWSVEPEREDARGSCSQTSRLVLAQKPSPAGSREPRMACLQLQFGKTRTTFGLVNLHVP